MTVQDAVQNYEVARKALDEARYQQELATQRLVDADRDFLVAREVLRDAVQMESDSLLTNEPHRN